MPIRPLTILGALVALLALFTRSGAGEINRRRLDHITPRTSSCSVTSFHSSRRRPASTCVSSHRARAKRSILAGGAMPMSSVRACQGAGGEVRRGRLWREALSGYVQRLRLDRCGGAIRPASRAWTTSWRRYRLSRRRLRLSFRAADRSGTHIRELDLWKAAGIDIAKTKVVGARRSVRAWRSRSTPPPLPTLMCFPIAAPGCRLRTAGNLISSFRATSGCSTSMT